MITWDAYLFLEDLEAELDSPFHGLLDEGEEKNPFKETGEPTPEEKEQELAEQCYFEWRVQELQRKWNAFPLQHHAYSRKRDWLAHFPTDDDIPF